ncbi:hypothetical protein HELRODRAFT_183167 [Helobdella robusta]|uniref:Uncharacterized protein n=1 Tax=Helobdella robusta TaxID=6412 RepID=T1FJ91_HELRO|nr:hypothetical protein HELRODRAFT_183167 [Helobdella robusta]ESO11472.1 hypothetical protein HELRODRAFT_183167 [Helobdella robusta]
MEKHSIRSKTKPKLRTLPVVVAKSDPHTHVQHKQKIEQMKKVISKKTGMILSFQFSLFLLFNSNLNKISTKRKKHSIVHCHHTHLILEIVCSWTEGCMRGQSKIRTSNQNGNCVFSNNVITNNTIKISCNKTNVSHSRTVDHIISDKSNIITRNKFNASDISTNHHIFKEEWKNQIQHKKQTFFDLNGSASSGGVL